jgi:hypothetical protein
MNATGNFSMLQQASEIKPTILISVTWNSISNVSTSVQGNNKMCSELGQWQRERSGACGGS